MDWLGTLVFGVLGVGVRSDASLDVAIVGAGPAGLATAVACRASGLTFQVLEQDRWGGTIANYPRHKVVMTDKVTLPGFGPFGRKTLSKEQLVASWREVLAQTGVEVQEQVSVTAIGGTDGKLAVQTTRGELTARKVVLAMGRRGTPRRLEVPGSQLDKVCYRLLEPEQYAGKKVLVVGGGDSALEAAIALAAVTGTIVDVSYRNPAFGRCRPQNRDRITALTASGRVHAYLGTEVADVRPQEVTLKAQDGSQSVIANDYVIVNIGGTLPDEFLKQAGIAISRHHGETEEKRHARATRLARRSHANKLRFPWLAVALALLGTAIVAVLYLHGEQYYWLGKAARLKSPLHQTLRPAGVFGHGIGVVATAVMLMNFLYALRKRVAALRNLGSLRTWLSFHVFVGVLSPLVIAFHAAFRSNNLLASATSAALAFVVGTGLIGLFVFAFIPAVGGRLLNHSEIESHWRKLAAEVRGFACRSSQPARLEHLAAAILAPPQTRRSLVLMLLRAPIEPVIAHWRTHKARNLFPSREVYGEFRRAFIALLRARAQMAFYERVRRFMSGWRILHVVLSIFLVLVIALHIALSVYLGYRWILK